MWESNGNNVRGGGCWGDVKLKMNEKDVCDWWFHDWDDEEEEIMKWDILNSCVWDWFINRWCVCVILLNWEKQSRNEGYHACSFKRTNKKVCP